MSRIYTLFSPPSFPPRGKSTPLSIISHSSFPSRQERASTHTKIAKLLILPCASQYKVRGEETIYDDDGIPISQVRERTDWNPALGGRDPCGQAKNPDDGLCSLATPPGVGPSYVRQQQLG